MLSVLSVACGPIHQELRPRVEVVRALKRVALVISKDGEFTVFDERARATGTPAVLFGLVGAAVASAANASADEESANSLAAFLEHAECRGRFQAAFERTLAESKRISAEPKPDLVHAKQSGADAVVIFRIESCGFRLVSQESLEMAAFIDLSARLELSNGEVGWDDRETVIATTHTTLAGLKREPALARRLFEEVLDDAGRRMANNLLYP